MTKNNIILWHGSSRWDGTPQVRHSSKGRYECGPGIYLTNIFMTAKKYCKGGGSLMKMTLSPDINWSSDCRVDVYEMISFINNSPRMRNKSAVRADLLACAAMEKNQNISVENLINLCVFHETLSGIHGPALAEWLTKHGADASIHRPKSGESWVVVFNPKIIIRWEKVQSSKVDLEERDLPVV